MHSLLHICQVLLIFYINVWSNCTPNNLFSSTNEGQRSGTTTEQLQTTLQLRSEEPLLILSLKLKIFGLSTKARQVCLYSTFQQGNSKCRTQTIPDVTSVSVLPVKWLYAEFEWLCYPLNWNQSLERHLLFVLHFNAKQFKKKMESKVNLKCRIAFVILAHGLMHVKPFLVWRCDKFQTDLWPVMDELTARFQEGFCFHSSWGYLYGHRTSNVMAKVCLQGLRVKVMFNIEWAADHFPDKWFGSGNLKKNNCGQQYFDDKQQWIHWWSFEKLIWR